MGLVPFSSLSSLCQSTFWRVPSLAHWLGSFFPRFRYLKETAGFFTDQIEGLKC